MPNRPFCKAALWLGWLFVARVRNSRRAQSESSAWETLGPLLVAEYAAAREVVLHARQIQHQVVSWSVAAVGLIVSGAAVFLTRGQGTLSPEAVAYSVLTLLAAVLPGVAASSALVWTGEVARHQRAAEFLRDFERELERSLPDAPMTVSYDRFVAGENTERRVSPTAFGRLGVILLLIGMIVLSAFAASVLLWSGGAFNGWHVFARLLVQCGVALEGVLSLSFGLRWWWRTRGTGST